MFKLASALALAAACTPFVVGCHHAVIIDPALSPTLEPAADAEAHAAQPDGQRIPAALAGVAYDRDQGAQWSLPLQAGTCYTFGYASDPSVARLSLYIFSPTNHRLDSQRGGLPQGVFRHCATENGMYRLEAKVAAGAGHFVVVTYAKAGPPPQAAPVAVVAAPPTLEEIITSVAASAAPGAARVGNFYAGTGDQTDWYTQLNAGSCYWFIGAGDPGNVKSLYMYLWDPRMSRLTENRSDTSTSMVGYCATAPGMYKFEAKLNRGSGAYKVGVFAKNTP